MFRGGGNISSFGFFLIEGVVFSLVIFIHSTFPSSFYTICDRINNIVSDPFPWLEMSWPRPHQDDICLLSRKMPRVSEGTGGREVLKKIPVSLWSFITPPTMPFLKPSNFTRFLLKISPWLILCPWRSCLAQNCWRYWKEVLSTHFLLAMSSRTGSIFQWKAIPLSSILWRIWTNPDSVCFYFIVVVVVVATLCVYWTIYIFVCSERFFCFASL